MVRHDDKVAKLPGTSDFDVKADKIFSVSSDLACVTRNYLGKERSHKIYFRKQRDPDHYEIIENP